MGNFLLLLRSDPVQAGSLPSLSSGLKLAQRLGFPKPSSSVDENRTCAAIFPRTNGSGSPIVFDQETGSWLLAIGSWFHSAGFHSGDEAKLLKRYAEVGSVQLANELEGFFVIAGGSLRTDQAEVISDLAGSCHCFLREFKDGTAISGSSLMLAGLGDFALDPIGCQEFLATGIIYEDRTLFKEVRKLGPASVFVFHRGRLSSRQLYWKIQDIEPESLDGPSAVRAFGEALTQTARKISSACSNPVCDLTGGYDSRALAAGLLSAGMRFATTVSGHLESPDVVISRGLANMLGLPHQNLNAEPATSFERIKTAVSFTDGEYDLVEYVRILGIHQKLAERFDISLNGSYGELARGYWWELLIPHTSARRKLDSEKLARLRYAAQAAGPQLFPDEHRIRWVEHFIGVIERTNAGLSELPNTLQMDHAYLRMRMQRWQGRIASSTNRIWPCLSPFLFRSILEVVLKTKARMRTRSLLVRHMLATYQPRMAAFPLEHGYPAEPLSWTNFHRFLPLINFYAAKVQSRVVRGLGRPAMRQEKTSSPLPGFWTQEAVQCLFSPENMILRSIADPILLWKFHENSRKPDFQPNEFGTRVMTLECAISILRNALRNGFAKEGSK